MRLLVDDVIHELRKQLDGACSLTHSILINLFVKLSPILSKTVQFVFDEQGLERHTFFPR